MLGAASQSWNINNKGMKFSMAGNKTAKDRAADLVRLNVSLDGPTRAFFRELGDGQLSLGARVSARILAAVFRGMSDEVRADAIARAQRID